MCKHKKKVTKNELSHHLHVCCRSLHDDEPRLFLNLLKKEMFSFYRNQLSNESISLIQSHLQEELHRRQNEGIPRFQSLADSKNRKNDKDRVQSTLFLPEIGKQLLFECFFCFFFPYKFNTQIRKKKKQKKNKKNKKMKRLAIDHILQQQ